MICSLLWIFLIDNLFSKKISLQYFIVLFNLSVHEDSNITSTKVWSGEEENEESINDDVDSTTPYDDKISSEGQENLQRSSSSKTICNDNDKDVENENYNNTSNMLSIDSNSIEDDKIEKQPPPKSPFFLKQLDLSDDMVSYGQNTSQTSAGKTKSKKSAQSPLQRKLRGFSTLSSSRSAQIHFKTLMLK